MCPVSATPDTSRHIFWFVAAANSAKNGRGDAGIPVAIWAVMLLSPKSERSAPQAPERESLIKRNRLPERSSPARPEQRTTWTSQFRHSQRLRLAGPARYPRRARADLVPPAPTFPLRFAVGADKGIDEPNTLARRESDRSPGNATPISARQRIHGTRHRDAGSRSFHCHFIVRRADWPLLGA